MKKTEIARFMSAKIVPDNINIELIPSKNYIICHIICCQILAAGSLKEIAIPPVDSFNYMKSGKSYRVIVEAAGCPCLLP